MPAADDRWDLPLAVSLFAVHFAQALLYASAYPLLRYGTDLVAYFVWFQSWWTGDASLRALDFFVVPKPLLVFTLGALGSVPGAFLCSALASAAIGALAYLLGRALFDRTVGLLFSLALLLDAEKLLLTVRSQADLFVGLFLLAAMLLAVHRRHGLAAASLLLSALIKPVTVPCALAFLVPDGDGHRPWRWALLPLAAVPLVALANQALLGEPTGPARYLASFDDLHRGAAIGGSEVLHFAVWTQLVRSAFVSTAPWGLLGLTVWLGRARDRLASPALLLPLLFLAGWIVLAAAAPFTPFFRFFWPVQVWFLGFIVFAMVETARRVARERRALAVGLAAALLAFLAGDQLAQQARYRERFAQPHERTMAFVARAAATLADEHRPGETVRAPVAFAPYLMWRAGVPASELAVGPGPRPPAWILLLPDPERADAAGDALVRLTRDAGYVVRVSDGPAALLGRPRAS